MVSFPKALVAALLGLAMVSSPAAAASPPDSAYAFSQPQTAPVRAATNFDGALRCMDELLLRSNYGAGYRLVPTALMDPKGDVGAATLDMIIAAASQMSEKSRFFTVLGAISDDTAKKMSEDTKLAFFVKGSITEFDKAVTAKSTGGFLGFAGNGLSRNRQSTNSILTVTLYLTDKDGVVIPGTVQSVRMAITQKNDSDDLIANIGSSGAAFNMEFTRSDGVHQALRSLIDLALIQSVGGYSQVPYHRCLLETGSDPATLQKARHAFDAMKGPQQVKAIADGLIAIGLLKSPPPTVLDGALKEAIAEYEVNQRMPAIGLPTFEVYYSLYSSQYDTGGPAPEPTRLDSGPAIKIAPYGPSFETGGDYNQQVLLGSRLTFVVTTVQNVHVVCYYTDAESNTTRIFPNRERPSDLLLARTPLMLPGPQDVFTIEPAKANVREQVVCLASPTPFLTSLPIELQAELHSGRAIRLTADQVLEEAQRADIKPIYSDKIEYRVYAPPQ